MQEEIQSCQVEDPDTREIKLDTGMLSSKPLLQSIYAETLRLRIALIVGRTPEYENFHLEGWIFPPQEMIAISSRAGAMNPEIWNAGTRENPHPLDTFWADRFLIYPDDPTSGPLRKERFDLEDCKSGCPKSDRVSKGTPVFSTDGLAGAWIPYGGGQRMCPGRHFAKQEMIATFAIFMTNYDIELTVSWDDPPASDMDFFPFGGLPPTKAIPFRMRRR